ncbi:thioesterase family protein [Streptomyces blattellae]|uniref:thioesterase family protein n=1 Tax=Streptomyces blattellae TaxID=2569855 RepID=UPI0012B8CC71|nr:thioesterase family protein [Streptomyces blattellae]
MSLPLFRETARPEWIDYNGHLSEAYYVLVFGFATDELMERTGLDAAYRERTCCSLYTAESHVRYLREVLEGSQLAVHTRVLGAAGKKARFTHEMYVVEGPRAEPDPVATIELLMLHVDQGAGRDVPFPPEIRERLAALAEEPPGWAGRSIGPVVTGPGAR